MLPERLHARIRHQLALPEPDLEARSLAVELAELGQRARERLEQCATLIRLGNEQAALQAAETEPSLPELCASISFSGCVEWARLCQRHGLPVTPAPDDAQVVAVELLYGKPIDENHPLYRDYRQAIRERDEGRALAVLRSITAVNPGDGNAQTELNRLRAKFMRDSLGKVASLFAEEKTEAAVQLMGRMEQLGIAGIIDDPAWQEAIARRGEWVSGQARLRLTGWARRAAEARANGDWRTCADAVGAARTVERNSGVNATESETLTLADCERWAAEHVATAAAAHQASAEAEALRAEWASLSEEAGRRRSADLLRRVNHWIDRARLAVDQVGEAPLADAESLSRGLHRVVVRHHTLRTAAGVAVLLAAVVAGHIAYQSSVAQSALGQALAAIDAPLSEWDFDTAESRLAEARQLATTEELVAEYSRRESELRAQISERRMVEQSLSAEAVFLANAGAAGIDAANFAEVARRARALESALAKASPAAARRIRARGGDLAKLIARCEGIAQGLRSQVDELSDSLEQALGSGERLADAAKAAAAARRLHDILEQPGARAVVGTDTADAALALAERASQRVALDQARAGAVRRLDDAVDLRGYLAAAASLADSAEESPEKAAAQHIRENAELLGGLPRNVLANRVGAMWDAAATPEPASFTPNQEEAALVARLADGEILRNLRKYIIRKHESPEPGVTTTVTVEPEYIVGKPVAETRRLGEGTETVFTARVLRSSGDVQERQWSLRRFNNGVTSGLEPVEGLPLPEVDYQARFARFFTLVGGRLAESPLRSLERVRRESGSPLLRAYHLQELYRLAAIRPAESGLAFSPSAQRDAARLRGITQNSLRPTEFVFSTDAALRTEINGFLAAGTAGYAGEARFLRTLLEGMRRGGTVLVGRAGIDGRPSWRSAPAPGSVILGLDSEGRPAALFEFGADGSLTALANAAPLSPLVRLATSPAEAAEAAGAPPADVKPPAGGWNNLLKGKDL